MDMLPSLCAAMVRANGDSLLLESGRAPYVMSGTHRQDVAKATLSDNALEALVAQIFSGPGRDAFRETGRTAEDVDVPSAGLTLKATAERRDGAIVIELRRTPTYELEPTDIPPPSVDEGLFAAPEHPLPAAEQLSGWETTPGLFLDHSQDEGAPEEPGAVFESVRNDDDSWAHVALEAPAAPAMAIEDEPSPMPFAAAVSPYEEEPLVPAPMPVRAQAPPVVAPPGASWSDTRAVPDTDLVAWASEAADKGASALYLRAGSAPVVRVEDRLDPISSAILDHVTVNQLISDLEDGGDPTWQRGSDGEWVRLDARLGRLSCRIFADDEGRGLIVRLQPAATARSLNRLVPRKVRAACDGDGLIVVSAPNADDALAMASTVADMAGTRRGGYVVALRPQGAPRAQVSGSFVSQREFQSHEAGAAIRNAVAESPDILLVTLSQSDGTTREIARAAENGRLVVLSVASPTSLQSLRSLVGRGTSAADAQLRLSLASNFRAAFATRTLRRLGGGRTIVQDLLLGTSEVSGLIASGDFAGITRLQRQGLGGMFTVDERLARGVQRGHLPLRQAVENSLDRRHQVSLVRSSGRGTRRGSARHDASLESQLQPVGAGRISGQRGTSR